MSYKKYYLYKEQVSYDGGDWEDTGNQAPSGDPIGSYSTYADCITQYRWTPSGTTCVGYNKTQNNIREESNDGGITWTVSTPAVYSASTIIEAECSECGYTPPEEFNGKYKLTLRNGSTISAACDESSAITRNEISAYTANVVSAVIGNCCTEISARTFSGCTSLTSVTIPNSVTNIGTSAFTSCVGLTSVYIPNSASMDDYVFKFCTGLKNVYLNSKNFGMGTFWGCSNLSAATIGNSISSITSRGFLFDRKLVNLTLPNCITSIGSTAFKECIKLKSINLPNGVTKINDGAFKDCSGLTSVYIPDSVTFIDSSAFSRCKNISSVTIPDSVTSLRTAAFSGCTSLTSVTSLSITPPYAGSGYASDGHMFDDTNNCPIYVPPESVYRYRTDEYWSPYASRIQPIPT